MNAARNANRLNIRFVTFRVGLMVPQVHEFLLIAGPKTVVAQDSDSRR